MSIRRLLVQIPFFFFEREIDFEIKGQTLVFVGVMDDGKSDGTHFSSIYVYFSFQILCSSTRIKN